MSVRKEIISIGVYPFKKGVFIFSLLKLFFTNALWNHLTRKSNAYSKRLKIFFTGKSTVRFSKEIQNVSLISTFSPVAQSCPTLCDPMNHSTPGLPVHHQFPEFTQTHVHGVGDAIQPSHPLSSPSPPAPNPSQHQTLFQ